MNVGSLYLGGGIIGSIIALFAGHWFSQIESFPGQNKWDDHFTNRVKQFRPRGGFGAAAGRWTQEPFAAP